MNASQPELGGGDSSPGATQATQDELCMDECEYTQVETYSQQPDGEEENKKAAPTPWGRLIPMAGGGPVNLMPREEQGGGGRAMNEVTLGRSKACEVVVDDKRVSSKHCRIYCEVVSGHSVFEPMQVYIEDMSVNGTWVNQSTQLQKGVRRLLNSGDEICVLKPIKPGAPSAQREAELEAATFTFVNLDRNRGVGGAGSARDSARSPSRRAGTRAASLAGAAGAVARVRSPTLRSSPSGSLGMFGGPARAIENLYDIRETIGHGTSGEVRRAINRVTGKQVAVKVIETRKFALTPGLTPTELVQEAEMLKRVNHAYIIKLEDIFKTEEAVYLVMELVSGGDLFDRIVERGVYEEALAQELLFRVLTAVDYLHRKDIVHRDLKPENILLVSNDNDVDVKITDFGLAKRANKEGLKTFCGTPQYFAPEVLKRRNTVLGVGRYGKEADMWSVGVILYILLSGTHPFHSSTLFDQISHAHYSLDGPEWEAIGPPAKDLVRKLLTQEPEARLTAAQALEHPFITERPGAELAAAAGAGAAAGGAAAAVWPSGKASSMSPASAATAASGEGRTESWASEATTTAAGGDGGAASGVGSCEPGASRSSPAAAAAPAAGETTPAQGAAAGSTAGGGGSAKGATPPTPTGPRTTAAAVAPPTPGRGLRGQRAGVGSGDRGHVRGGRGGGGGGGGGGRGGTPASGRKGRGSRGGGSSGGSSGGRKRAKKDVDRGAAPYSQLQIQVVVAGPGPASSQGLSQGSGPGSPGGSQSQGTGLGPEVAGGANTKDGQQPHSDGRSEARSDLPPPPDRGPGRGEEQVPTPAQSQGQAQARAPAPAGGTARQSGAAGKRKGAAAGTPAEGSGRGGRGGGTRGGRGRGRGAGAGAGTKSKKRGARSGAVAAAAATATEAAAAASASDLATDDICEYSSDDSPVKAKRRRAGPGAGRTSGPSSAAGAGAGTGAGAGPRAGAGAQMPRQGHSGGSGGGSGGQKSQAAAARSPSLSGADGARARRASGRQTLLQVGQDGRIDLAHAPTAATVAQAPATSAAEVPATSAAEAPAAPAPAAAVQVPDPALAAPGETVPASNGCGPLEARGSDAEGASGPGSVEAAAAVVEAGGGGSSGGGRGSGSARGGRGGAAAGRKPAKRGGGSGAGGGGGGGGKPQRTLSSFLVRAHDGAASQPQAGVAR